MAILKNISGTTKNEFSIGNLSPVAVRTNNGTAEFKHSNSIEDNVWRKMTSINDVIDNNIPSLSQYRNITKEYATDTMSNEFINNYFNVNKDSNGFPGVSSGDDPFTQFPEGYYHCVIRDHVDESDEYLWSISRTRHFVLEEAGTPFNVPDKLVKRNTTGDFATHSIYLEDMQDGTGTKPQLVIGGNQGDTDQELMISIYGETGVELGKGSPGEGSVEFYAYNTLAKSASIKREQGRDSHLIIEQFGNGHIQFKHDSVLSAFIDASGRFVANNDMYVNGQFTTTNDYIIQHGVGASRFFANTIDIGILDDTAITKPSNLQFSNHKIVNGAAGEEYNGGLIHSPSDDATTAGGLYFYSNKDKQPGALTDYGTQYLRLKLADTATGADPSEFWGIAQQARYA